MNNKFFNVLKRYDINWRTAGSLFDILEKHRYFLSVNSEEICGAYKLWYKQNGCYFENKAKTIKIIEIVKSIFEENKKLPDDAIINSPWGDKEIELYSEKKSVSIKVNKNATYQKLLDKWEELSKKIIKIGPYGPICPKCKSNEMDVYGSNFHCIKCKSEIHISEIIKRGKLMSKKEMKERYS